MGETGTVAAFALDVVVTGIRLGAVACSSDDLIAFLTYGVTPVARRGGVSRGGEVRPGMRVRGRTPSPLLFDVAIAARGLLRRNTEVSQETVRAVDRRVEGLPVPIHDIGLASRQGGEYDRRDKELKSPRHNNLP